MSARTDYALAHPCTDPRTIPVTAALAADEPMAGGNLVHSILAVDR